MIRRPPRSTPTDTLFPYTTLFRSYQMIRTGTTMTPTIFSHPDRQPRKFRPFKAFQHFRKLIADKEDTEQVFHIFENLPRKGFMDDESSEERRVGKGCVSTCRAGVSRDP